jgi:cell shape-determining protein MreD
MNALLGLGILAAIIYGVIFDATYWKIYGICFVVYLLFVMLMTNRRDNHKRRILTLSTWSCKLIR